MVEAAPVEVLKRGSPRIDGLEWSSYNRGASSKSPSRITDHRREVAALIGIRAIGARAGVCDFAGERPHGGAAPE